jgi:putative drug exporter of the RND superfamily
VGSISRRRNTRRLSTRRPVGIATAVVILLLVLGSPFLRIAFGQPDDRVLPPGNEVRLVQDQLRSAFDGDEATTVEVVAPALGVTDPSLADPEIEAYAAELSTVPGAVRVDALTGSYVGGVRVAEPGPASARFAAEGATWFSVVPGVEPMSPAGEQLVQDIRALDAPFETLVGGSSAQLVDAKDVLFSRLPIAVAFISLVTLVVLFLLFGSVLVPLKALVLNFLSLSATFGAMVWIFQDGNLADFFGFTPTGTIDVSMPILMFCIAFGLSMDYEVFLLSRIKEEHDRGADTETSVAVGLERTGRIVTAAALLMAVVFVAFGTSGITFLKMFGLGLALAVLIDAFLIRATLVPAFMRLAGELNWWAPAPLRRFHDRFGIAETVDLDEADATVAAVDTVRPVALGTRE